MPESLSLQGLNKINFVPLEVIPEKELIIGLIGQFWTPSGKLKKFKSEEFVGFTNNQFAKATWNFELVKVNATTTHLHTETRVFCPTQKTKKQFRRYWFFIQPLSTWIRHEILKAIKKQAEGRKNI